MEKSTPRDIHERASSPTIDIRAALEQARPRNLNDPLPHRHSLPGELPESPTVNIAAALEQARPRNNPNHSLTAQRVLPPDSPVSSVQDNSQQKAGVAISPMAVPEREHDTDEDQPEAWATPEQIERARREFFGANYGKQVQKLQSGDRSRLMTLEEMMRPSNLLGLHGLEPKKSSVPPRFQFCLSNLGSAEFSRDQAFQDILETNSKEKADRMVAHKLQMEFLHRDQEEDDMMAQPDSSYRPNLNNKGTHRIGS